MPAREAAGMSERRTTVDAELKVVSAELLLADATEAPVERAPTVERARNERPKATDESSVVERWHEAVSLPAQVPAS